MFSSILQILPSRKPVVVGKTHLRNPHSITRRVFARWLRRTHRSVRPNPPRLLFGELLAPSGILSTKLSRSHGSMAEDCQCRRHQ